VTAGSRLNNKIHMSDRKMKPTQSIRDTAAPGIRQAWNVLGVSTGAAEHGHMAAG